MGVGRGRRRRTVGLCEVDAGLCCRIYIYLCVAQETREPEERNPASSSDSALSCEVQQLNRGGTAGEERELLVYTTSLFLSCKGTTTHCISAMFLFSRAWIWSA